jgi:hypothetical protein
MATNFTSLRNSRKDIINKLAAEVRKASSPQKGGADERFWKLSVDAKTGIGYAKLRFLPAPKDEDVPWVRIFSHGFQGSDGSWFIENCPTTLENRLCPVCKENNKLWNSGIESDKDIARQRKRKLQFISNILVLEDSAHPENNGKVFLFKYGKKIHDKIGELLEPKFPDQKPTDPFDFWEGCEFKLKAQKVGGYQNYDKSEFTNPVGLFAGDDAKTEATWEQEYALSEFTKESEFKNYEDLAKRFTRVLTGDPDDRAETAAEIIEREAKLPVPASAPAVARTLAPTPARTAPVRETISTSDDDEVNKFFADVLGDDAF